jgi:hypothetical protein
MWIARPAGFGKDLHQLAEVAHRKVKRRSLSPGCAGIRLFHTNGRRPALGFGGHKVTL